MKAILIRQPWAWLIVHGYKDVENRTWSTKYRGPILIHAGKTLDPYLNKSGRVCWHRASNFLTLSISSAGALWGRRTSLTV